MLKQSQPFLVLGGIVVVLFLGFIGYKTFSQPSVEYKSLEVKWIRVVRGSEAGTVDVVARIVNPNRDVGSPRFAYTLTLLKAQGSRLKGDESDIIEPSALSSGPLAARSGKSYILPDEEKYLIETDIPWDTSHEFPEATFTFGRTRFRPLLKPQNLQLSLSEDRLTIDQEQGTSTVKGRIKNIGKEDLHDIELQVVVYPFSLMPNPQDAVAVNRLVVPKLAMGEESPFQFIWHRALNSPEFLYDLVFEVNPYE